MRKNNRTGKRLRLIPLILGGYGVFLGLGLVAIGLSEMKEGIGIVRLLIGLGIAGFGLLGIWDGVRDLVKPDKKQEQTPASQFVFTDVSGNRSSLINLEVLREQTSILAESEEPKRFEIQILPPFSVEGHGLLKHILCIYHSDIILSAFFEMPEGGYRIYQKSTVPDRAVEWLEQLLAGNPDFSEWESMKTTAQPDEENASQRAEDDQWDEADADLDEMGDEADETDIFSGESDVPQGGMEAFWHQLLGGQKGQMLYWHKLLIIFGESWCDEHKFFSARDVELAIEGIHEGKYIKAVLEWGTKAFDLFPGVQNGVMVIWRTNNTEKGDVRFLAKEGTVTQVKFWLVNYMNSGVFEETSGWVDITSQIEKVKRKGEKGHGKVF